MSGDPAGTAPLLRVDGPRATLTLNRPTLHNRLDAADVAALRDAIDAIDADRTVQVLVVTGTGRSFCSGYDLRALDAPQAHRLEPRADFQAMTDAVENARPVVIARLNGPCYGGGTDLALACDFRIAVDTVRMFMPAARIGLHFYPHGLRRWVTRLGLGPAKRLFLTARTIDAAEMLRIGFVDELVSVDALDATVDALVAELLAMPPRVVEGMKRTLNQIARDEFDDAAGQAAHEASYATHDMKEAFAAMAEKRAPRFSGE